MSLNSTKNTATQKMIKSYKDKINSIKESFQNESKDNIQNQLKAILIGIDKNINNTQEKINKTKKEKNKSTSCRWIEGRKRKIKKLEHTKEQRREIKKTTNKLFKNLKQK